MLFFGIGLIWLVMYFTLGIMLLLAGLRWLYMIFTDDEFEKQELKKYGVKHN